MKVWPQLIRGFLVCALVAACGERKSPVTDSQPVANRSYVGSAACQSCHEAQYADWEKSHHRMAMQPPTPEFVSGDFSGSTFEYADIDYEFLTRDGAYRVRADNAQGEIQEFEIAYTFGVEPLQQYLVEFPDGRLQALGVAWDTRPESDGGQRWFHLYPDENITAGDELHWTARNQNWNFMCADCHSTDVRKNYSIATDTFATSYAEVTVGCEACHGPGSTHVASGGQGGFGAGDAAHELSSQSGEVETCARCHSRRGVVAEGFDPGAAFMDHYRPALLDEGLYHADGQILDEVYVYGSFLQSRMHQRGVRCSDCHNPHSANLAVRGDETCTTCHRAEPPARFPTLKAASYDQAAHHFHEPASEGARCVSCHMPERTYMVIDGRRDHSFRIPRPDLSASTGTPNACNDCHADRSPEWAAAEIAQRFPGQKAFDYGEAIAAGRAGAEGAATQLIEVAADMTVPAIARGTALELLRGHSDAESIAALEAGLRDPDPLVRQGALAGTDRLAIRQRWQIARHLLDDDRKSIRNDAAALLAPMLSEDLRQAERDALLAALRDYEDTQLLNADRPEALTNLGSVYAMSGNHSGAEDALKQALALDPEWLPALINLADFYRSTGRDTDARELLDRAVNIAPNSAAARYARGLLLVRAGEQDAAIADIERASQLDPAEPRYRYAYGIALNSTGRRDDAIRELENGLRDFPGNAEMLYALAAIERDVGNTRRALAYADELVNLHPQFPGALQLQRELRSASEN